METEGKTTPKMGWKGKAVLAFIGLVVISSIFGSDDEPVATDTSSQAVQAAGLEESLEAPAIAPEPTSRLSGPQENARRSAEDYLAFKAFSRAGLIEQLSSEYGSGFDESDAAVAVDSLNVDWNAQAARSAEEYLGFKGFSCNGLIEQLSSEYGSQFTAEQATYGANQTSAC